MATPPRYVGRPDTVTFLYDLALYADDHIGRRLGLDLEHLAGDIVKHDDVRDRECRDLRNTAEELEVQAFKHIK